MTLEEKLMDIDFSRFSKVQDTLLQRINNRRRLERELMDEEELDEVAAAGNPLVKKYPPLKSKLKKRRLSVKTWSAFFNFLKKIFRRERIEFNYSEINFQIKRKAESL